MEKQLIIVQLNTDYCNYLRQFDSKVPYNYNDKKIRPFVGVLFTVNKCMYFAPLSSPKPKHIKMISKMDYGKLGAINFNNMVPVTDNNIIYLDLNKKCNSESEKQYMTLLKKQLNWLNRYSKNLHEKSKKLYDKYVNGTLNANIAKRCCNFPLLEEKCEEYNRKK